MTSDEAEAAQWLDERFWANLDSAQQVFLWWPKRNAETFKRMWLCKAILATSSRPVDIVHEGILARHVEIRYYNPKDFTILALRYAR